MRFSVASRDVNDLQDIAAGMVGARDCGTVADYIPSLNSAAHRLFSIQSISKMFTLMLSLGRVGDELSD